MPGIKWRHARTRKEPGCLLCFNVTRSKWHTARQFAHLLGVALLRDSRCLQHWKKFLIRKFLCVGEGVVIIACLCVYFVLVGGLTNHLFPQLPLIYRLNFKQKYERECVLCSQKRTPWSFVLRRWQFVSRDTWWSGWLWHCVTNRKVTDSIPRWCHWDFSLIQSFWSELWPWVRLSL